ncbi:hypothetical protein BS78_02G327800 [Paspalum vaginatum]|nr:hypothetical protein BS78_02G327800 [Paspalum vaginatum]
MKPILLHLYRQSGATYEDPVDFSRERNAPAVYLARIPICSSPRKAITRNSILTFLRQCSFQCSARQNSLQASPPTFVLGNKRAAMSSSYLCCVGPCTAVPNIASALVNQVLFHNTCNVTNSMKQYFWANS